MLKRAQFYYRNSSPGAEDAKRFLEDHGVVVSARDILKQPLTKRELTLILGYHDPKHYLDITSPAFRRKKLDKSMPPRGELLEMILEHPELLRSPVVLSGRLMTIGFNRQQLIEMFQLTVSNSKASEEAGASSGGRDKHS